MHVSFCGMYGHAIKKSLEEAKMCIKNKNF